MTSTTTNENNNSDIENKKSEKKKSENASKNVGGNIIPFVIKVLIIVLIIVLYFIHSSVILYTCKVGQANIIPTNTDCAPFTNYEMKIDEIETNIFLTNTKPQESVKLKFPYDTYNSQNYFLDIFRKYKESPKSNFLVNYFYSIIEGLMGYNNKAINFFLNSFNNSPEMIILLFGPVLYSVYLFFVHIIGFFVVSIYYYFKSMSWFFKTNDNSNMNEKAKWSNVTLLEPVNYGLGIFFVVLFFILFWIMLFTVIPILNTITLTICLFSTLGYKGVIDNKEVTVLDIIKDSFKYHKMIISWIITVFVIIITFTSWGTIAGIVSIFVVILIFFKIIPLGLYETIIPANLSRVSSFKQAVKTCGNSEFDSSSFFGNLFGKKQKGGNIKKSLKIWKKLSNNV
jgi:hypothetical protein